MTNVYKCDGPDCDEYTPVEGAPDHNWKVMTDYFGDDGIDTLHYCSWDCVLASSREYVDASNTLSSEWLQNAIRNVHDAFSRMNTDTLQEEENADNQNNQSEDS